MPRMPQRERQERRKMQPFIRALRECNGKILSVDRSIRTLGLTGRFGRRGKREAGLLSMKVPDCIARTKQMNIWFEYDEFCHSLHRAPSSAPHSRCDRYNGDSESRRMLEIHRDLTRMTRRPTALIRYGADPAKYDARGDRCTDNPVLSRGQRIELCTRVIRKVAAHVPPQNGLLVIYVGYARTARSVAHGLNHIHVSDQEALRSLPRMLHEHGWVRSASPKSSASGCKQ